MNHDKAYRILKNELIRKFGNVCWYCGLELELGVEAHIDHILPVSHGGTNEIDNLALSCEFCNRAKLDHEATVLLRWLSRNRTGRFKCLILGQIKDSLSETEKDCLNKNF